MKPVTRSSKVRNYLRQGALLALTCGVMLAVMLAVRAYAFTMFSDPKTGERVLVNRIGCDALSKGQRVVFRQNETHFLGVVTALPGDTVGLAGSSYLIPQRCECNGTECDDCRYYLVKTSQGTTLVNHHDVVGKAIPLFFDN